MRTYVSIFSLLCLACANEPAPTSGWTAALNGDVVFPSDHECSELQQQIIRDALALAADVLVNRQDEFASCLANGHVILDSTNNDNADGWPEQIAAMMAQDRPTEVLCRPISSQAMGGHGIGGERMRLNHSYLENNQDRLHEIASTMAHEITHNLGFSHKGAHTRNRPRTIPEQVEECVLDLARGRDGVPRGTPRSVVSEETILAAAGSELLTPSIVECPSGSAVSGHRYSMEDGRIVGMRLVCRNQSTDRETLSAAIGDLGSENMDVTCADGVALGFEGYFGDRMNGHALVCSHSGTSLERLTPVGQDEGIRAERLCHGPRTTGGDGTQQVLVGYAATADDGVGRLHAICADATSLHNRAPFSIGEAFGTGTVGESPVERITVCSLGGALRELEVSMEDNGVFRLGGYCENLERSEPSEAIVTTNRQGIEWIGPPSSRNNGEQRELDCPTSTAMAGIRVSTSEDRVSALAPLCVDVAVWTSNLDAAPVDLGAIGDETNAVATETLRCERGEFIVGFRGRYSNPPVAGLKRWFDSLAPVCRRFEHL